MNRAWIDLKDILRQTVSSVYGDLVTRRTGQAVRGGIEQMLADWDGDQVVAIDFRTVRCMDFSCADEIVGKLLLEHGSARTFVLVGIDEAHRYALEPVLERHGLAVVAQDRTGGLDVLGPLSEAARQVFSVVIARGSTAPDAVAAALDVPLDAARGYLEELRERRLVAAGSEGYEPLRCA